MTPLKKEFKTKYGLYTYNAYDNILSKSNDLNSNIIDKINILMKNTLINNKYETVSIHPENNLYNFYLNNYLSGLSLSVTEECNLRCKYCCYSKRNNNNSKKAMSFETAQKALDFFLERSHKRNEINVSFYGGEPLLNFSLIKRCVDYLSNNSSQHIIYRITTNGLLLNEPIRKFLYEHNFLILISIDGPCIIHDRYRCTISNNPSFATIRKNIIEMRNENDKYFLENVKISSVAAPPINDIKLLYFFKNLSVPAYITNVTGPYLYEYLETINELDKVQKENIKINNLNNLISNEFIANPELVNLRSSLDSVNKIHNLKPSIKSKICTPNGFCAIGCHKLYVNASGNFFPCEKVNEDNKDYKIGNVDIGFDLIALENLYKKIEKLLYNKCKSCWAHKLCYMCAAFVFNLNEKSCEKIRLDIESNFLRYIEMVNEKPELFNA